MLRVGGSVSRYTRDLRSGACSVSGTTDEEGGPCYGKEKTFFVALRERIKRRGTRAKRRGTWVSSHLEERAGKESRQKKEVSKMGC